MSPLTLAAFLSTAAVALAACAGLGPPDTVALRVSPASKDGSAPGSVFAESIADLTAADREQRVERELLGGNVPEFLRTLVPVTTTATIADEVHEATYWVTADYLAVGHDDDFLRVPMTALTAQHIADRFGASLPTRKIVDDIHRAAKVQLEPRPFHPDDYDISSAPVFEASNRAIESARVGRGGLISGIKKDIVVSPRIAANPGRVVIYGWHRSSGHPIQPLYSGHTIPHVDYSHGVRLVSRRVWVDGVEMDLPALLADPVLWPLVSDEGPFESSRYDVR